MSRRSAAQSARLFALTKAAYEASDGVAPWDEASTDSAASAGTPARHVARVHRLTPRTVLCLAAAIALVVAFIAVRAVVAANATSPVSGAATSAPLSSATAPEPTGATGISFATPSPTLAADVVVHVAGQVASPGVVTLPAGSRVQDAVVAAGGPRGDADLDAVNLARPLVDGEQVYVPAPGQAPPASSIGGSGPDASAGLVNLNTADSTRLQALPGIGPSLAQRILDWRTEHGGFQSVGELEEVSGIGPAIMANIADLVTL